jgi:group I intron endonuclease
MAKDQSTLQGGVYQIRCIANGKVYVGSAICFDQRWTNHRNQLRRGVHCSRYLQNAWNKYGENQFVFEVLELACAADLICAEQEHLDRIQPFGSNGYNTCRLAGSQLGTKRTSESRKRMSAWQRGRKMSPERAAQWAAAALGFKRTPEHKARIAIANSERVVTEETRARMSAAKKGIGIGRKHTAETKAKIAAGNRRRSVSDETRAKMSAAQRGRLASLECRAKMSSSHLGRDISPEDILLAVRHVREGKTRVAVARMMGVPRCTVQRWVKTSSRQLT